MLKNILDTSELSGVYDNSSMFLDTVGLVIHLPYHMESVRYPFKSKSSKEPSSWKHEYSNGYSQYMFIRKKQFLLGEFEYKPAIAYRTRKTWYGGISYELIVEFSIPKLLIGNNFIDAPKYMLGTVYSKLLGIITGVYHFEDITIEMLEEATLKRMDCGSQVFFPNIESYNLAQDRIGSARLSLTTDIEKPQFSERSTGLNISCNSWQLVIYNKTEELKRYAKGKRRAKFEIDNELMVEDEQLFGCINDSDSVCMRFEVRLNGKAHIDAALKRIKEPVRPLTLQEAIENNIPQRILQWHFSQIVKGLPRADLVLASDEDILNRISKIEDKPDAMAKLYGYAMMERLPDQRKLRDIITSGKSRSAWTTYLKKLDALPELSDQQEPIQPVLDKVFGVPTEEPGPTSLYMSEVANARIIKIAVSITIRCCTKNRQFFSQWFARDARITANSRAPPRHGSPLGEV